VPDVRHILLTRFNLPLAAFPHDRAGRQTRTEDWLEHRLRLFRQACVPSVAAQSCRDFRWVVLIDAAGAETLRPRLESMCAGIDAVIVESPSARGWRRALRASLAPLPARLIVTRLDNDDALHPDYVHRAQQILMPLALGQAAFPAPPVVLNFSRGLCLNGERFFTYTYHQSPLTTWLVAAAPDDPAGFAPLPYDVPHNKVAESLPVIELLLREPMWVQVAHDRNVSNKARGTPLDALDASSEQAFGYLRAVAP
jgi:hypothetical protein